MPKEQISSSHSQEKKKARDQRAVRNLKDRYTQKEKKFCVGFFRIFVHPAIPILQSGSFSALLLAVGYKLNSSIGKILAQDQTGAYFTLFY